MLSHAKFFVDKSVASAKELLRKAPKEAIAKSALFLKFSSEIAGAAAQGVGEVVRNISSSTGQPAPGPQPQPDSDQMLPILIGGVGALVGFAIVLTCVHACVRTRPSGSYAALPGNQAARFSSSV